MNEYSYRTIIKFEYPLDNPIVVDTVEDSNGVKTEVTKSTKTILLPLDLIEARNVSKSSTIVTQPLLNGDTMADHMYRNPAELSISGAFGLYGRYGRFGDVDVYAELTDDYSNSTSAQDRLTAIESVFEKINHDGILCTIINCPIYDDTNKMVENNNSTRYLTRDNMVLERISWDEKNQSTLGYQFTFKEVIIVNGTEYETYEGADNPNLNNLTISTLSKSYLDANDEDLMIKIIQILQDEKCISGEWWKAFGETYGRVWQGAAGGAIVGGAILLAVFKGGVIVGALGATGVGLFAAAIIVGIVVIVAAGYAIYKAWKKYKNKKNKKKKAEYYIELHNGSIDDGLDKLNHMLTKAKAALAACDSSLQIGSFTENKDCEIVMSINNIYYTITATKDESIDISTGKSPWKFVKRLASASENDHSSDLECKGPIIGIANCSKYNYWFADDNYYTTKVWLVLNVDDSLNEDIKNIENKISTCKDNINYQNDRLSKDDRFTYQIEKAIAKYEKELEELESERESLYKKSYSLMSDLTNYQLLINDGDPNEAVKEIGKIIYNAVTGSD